MSLIIQGELLDEITLANGLSLSGSVLESEWSAGDVTSVGSGLALSGGALTAEWEGGNVTTLGGGIALAGGTLSADWSVGDVGALGLGLSLSGTTLEANWSAPAVNTIGTGLALNSGTLETSLASGAWNVQTATPANGGTVAVPSGCDLFLLAGTADLTTLTVHLAAPASNERPSTIIFQMGVATLDLVAPSGATFIVPPPTAAAPGGYFRSTVIGTLVVPC